MAKTAPEVPEVSELPTITELVENLPLDITDIVGQSRTEQHGRTRLSVQGVALIKEAGRRQGRGPRFDWVTVKVGKISGSLYLVPVDSKASDKLRLRWYDADQEVFFSLNKILKKQGTHIPPRHAMVMDVYLVNLQDVGAALELRLGQAKTEAIQQAKTTA